MSLSLSTPVPRQFMHMPVDCLPVPLHAQHVLKLGNDGLGGIPAIPGLGCGVMVSNLRNPDEIVGGCLLIAIN
jgi:hypothetical protein